MTERQPGTDRWVRVATSADGRPGTGMWVKRRDAPAATDGRTTPATDRIPSTDRIDRIPTDRMTRGPTPKNGTDRLPRTSPPDDANDGDVLPMTDAPATSPAVGQPSSQPPTRARNRSPTDPPTVSTIRAALPALSTPQSIVGWCMWSAIGTLLIEVQVIAWVANGVFRSWEGRAQLVLFAVPFGEAPPWLRIDHWLHAALAGVAVWWCHWPLAPRRGPWLAAALVAGLATLDEAAQRLDRERSAEWGDWLSSMCGVALAAGLIALLAAWRRRG